MSKLLIDTNILLLLVVGATNKSAIQRFKRTNQFTPADYDLLTRRVKQHAGVATTSAILAEASNLLAPRHSQAFVKWLFQHVEKLTDIPLTIKETIHDPAFDRLGYADAAILQAAQSRVTVITDDIHLYLELVRRRRHVINFHHLREMER